MLQVVFLSTPNCNFLPYTHYKFSFTNKVLVVKNSKVFAKNKALTFLDYSGFYTALFFAQVELNE